MNLNDFPRDVRYALFFLLGGWIWHFFFIYLVFVAGQEEAPTQMIYQQVAIVAVLGYFLYQAKKWARVLCLLCNSLIILLYLCFAALFWTPRPQLSIISIGVIACFAVASYLLMTREAMAFYTQPGEKSAAGNDSR